jgi:hypothetical protein
MKISYAKKKKRLLYIRISVWFGFKNSFFSAISSLGRGKAQIS